MMSFKNLSHLHGEGNVLIKHGHPEISFLASRVKESNEIDWKNYFV